jgi:hypothetical protein
MKHLLAHRRRIYNESIQVLIDKVVGNRSDVHLERTLNHVKYRAKKLLNTRKEGK